MMVPLLFLAMLCVMVVVAFYCLIRLRRHVKNMKRLIVEIVDLIEEREKRR